MVGLHLEDTPGSFSGSVTFGPAVLEQDKDDVSIIVAYYQSWAAGWINDYELDANFDFDTGAYLSSCYEISAVLPGYTISKVGWSNPQHNDGDVTDLDYYIY